MIGIKLITHQILNLHVTTIPFPPFCLHVHHYDLPDI